jgi:hypothetical protein
MSEPRGPRVYVSGTGRPGDPFVFADAGEPAGTWAERQAAIDEERRRRGDARLDRAQREALDRRDREDER